MVHQGQDLSSFLMLCFAWQNSTSSKCGVANCKSCDAESWCGSLFFVFHSIHCQDIILATHLFNLLLFFFTRVLPLGARRVVEDAFASKLSLRESPRNPSVLSCIISHAEQSTCSVVCRPQVQGQSTKSPAPSSFISTMVLMRLPRPTSVPCLPSSFSHSMCRCTRFVHCFALLCAQAGH